MSVSFSSNLFDENFEKCPNFSNANARIILSVLGFDSDELDGGTGVADFRRALMGAQNRPVTAFTRPTDVVMRPGTLQPRAVSFGLDEEGIRERLSRLETWVREVEELGATRVFWG